MNEQVIERATTTALMERTRAGYRPLCDKGKETGVMTREATTRVRPARQLPWLVGIVLLAGSLVAGGPATAWAQFLSGSSGTNGAFPPLPDNGANPIPSDYQVIVWNMATGRLAYCGQYAMGTGLDVCDPGTLPNAVAQIPNPPANGVYQFTNFNFTTVPGWSRHLVVVGTSPNTPLVILSQTDITISGTPNGNTAQLYVRGWDGRTPSPNSPSLSVPGGFGGPGGFSGGGSGNGGTTPSDGSPGFGPEGAAAGHVTASSAEFSGSSAQGSALNPSLSPLTGGSGGGGGAGLAAAPVSGCSANNYAGGGGGGGGGALLLAATNKVTIGGNGYIEAHGGQGAPSSNTCGFGGGGAGGNVRIVAQEITGTGGIRVWGGVRGNGTAPAGGGYVRFESSFNTYSGQITGAVGGSFVSFPTAPLPANQPQLTILSLDQSQAPSAPKASLSSPDITFANAVTAPVPLTVRANNVPLGTVVMIRVAPALGEPTTTTTTLQQGTFQESTAIAMVTLPPGAGVLSATATFNIGGGGGQQALNGVRFDGELAQRMEVVTQPDGTSKTFVIARSGARFEIGARQ